VESGAEGSGLKGTGPLFSQLQNNQTREEAIVISKLNVIGVLSCVLGVGFGTALQAAEKPSAPERMNPGLSVQGIEIIKGEVVRVKGQHFYLRQSDGKEMHLHAKPTTEMKRELKKGDRIEVQVDDQNNAVSIRQTK
jgi:Cu/Ag efflux protein CusF